MSAVYSPALKYSGNYSEVDSRNIYIQQQQQQRWHHHYQQQQQQQISGILRYRSAPSSSLAKLAERGGGCRGLDDQQHERRCYVPCFDAEMEGVLDSGSNNGWSNVKNEQEKGGEGGSVFCNEADQLIYNSHEGFQEFGVSGPCSTSVMMNNTVMGFQNSTQSKMASSGNHCSSSNLLLRQKSSPPGFFSNFSLTNATLSCEPSSSCPGRMPQIAESGNETLQHQEEEARTCVETRSLRSDNRSHHHKSYTPSFTSDFWESSSFTAHNKTACSDTNELVFSSSSDALESQVGEPKLSKKADQFEYKNVGLTHQLSLPNSSTKTKTGGGIERILHVQGSVPCKIRAKRGFATHPRSIAERVRRTRISERIKKLQELFPRSDKQTNTADMLDLAVDYIKDLQKQVKILTDTRAKCRCMSVQKQ